MTALKLVILVCLVFASIVSAFLPPARPPATPLKVFMAKGGSAEAQQVVEAYKAKARGTVSDKEIEQAFKKLVDLFKGDVTSAATVATIQPDVITYITTKPGLRNSNPNRYAFSRTRMANAPRTSLETIKECFDIYTETYGFDEALGMVTRNPNLLCVRPRGYGSAEAAGGDAMALSYVINATRGKGQYPLAILALLLLSKGVGFSFF